MLVSPEDLIPPDAPDDLRRFVAYWIAKAAGRTMPLFEEIDPIDLPWALSRLFVVRSIDGGRDFEYRLAGQQIYERHGGSIVGKRVGDLFRPTEVILERWRRVVTEPAACYTHAQHPTTTGLSLRGYRAVLPLGPGGGPADHMLGMSVYAEPGPDDPTPSEIEILDLRWVTLRDRA